MMIIIIITTTIVIVTIIIIVIVIIIIRCELGSRFCMMACATVTSGGQMHKARTGLVSAGPAFAPFRGWETTPV